MNSPGSKTSLEDARLDYHQRSLLQAIPNPILIKRKSGSWLWANQAFCHCFDLPSSDWCLDKEDRDIFPHASRELVYEDSTQSGSDASVWLWNSGIPQKTSQFRVQISPFQNESDDALLLVSLEAIEKTFDISAERFFQAVYQNPNEGLIQLDQDLIIQDANPAICSYLELTKTDLNGKHFQAFCKPEFWFELEKPFEQLKKGEIQHFEHTIQFMGRTANELRVQTTIYGLYNEQGRFEGAFASVENLTRKIGLTQVLSKMSKHVALASNETFFERLVKGIAEALEVEYVIIGELTIDKKQIVSSAFWNSNDFGNIDYFINGTPCEITISGTQPFVVKENIQEQFPHYELLQMVGAESYMGMPLINSRNEVIGLIATLDTKKIKYPFQLHDLLQIYSSRVVVELEQKEKQAELEAKNRELQEYIRSNTQLENFAYIASHDLKEPLRTIGNFAQLLSRRYKSLLDQSGQEFIEFIVGGVHKMNDLIDGLLLFSRVTEDKQPLETIQMDHLIASVLQSLSQLIIDQKATLNIGQLPKQITANPTQIQQLFQNLITNAIKFCKPGYQPEIHISSSELKHHWQFTIKDFGIGISESFFDKIFMLFQKLHPPQSYPGTGIGLALCKAIVEKHGGRIQVESEEGQYTAFHFTLAK